MKPHLVILAFVSSFIISSCSNPKETEKSEPVQEIQERPVAKNPGILISLEKAKEQLSNYNKAHPEEVGNEYALRTWISIEDLKAYIQYVEERSKEKGIEVSGIDFIHIQYKEAAPGSVNPNNEVYGLSLMLAPTYNKGSVHTAFDPIYSGQGKPKSLKSLLDEMTSNTGPDETSKKESEDEGVKPSSIGDNLSSCPNMCN